MILKASQRENILPLPVVLISTISKEGIRNAAPWSNFTPILRPLDEIVLASWIKRDTLNNTGYQRGWKETDEILPFFATERYHVDTGADFIPF